MTRFSSAWNRLANFFTDGNLAPFAVIVSIWHYWRALEPAGDPVFVAIPVAVFVDMLHYRTVRRAAHRRAPAAIGIALLTTLMAILYHRLFYGLAIADPLTVWLYALPLPIGIGIMAMHAASDMQDGLRAALERAQAAARKAQDRAKQLEAAVRQAKETAQEWQSRAVEAQRAAEQAQADAKRAHEAYADAQRRADTTQADRLDAQAFRTMNARYRSIARELAGQQDRDATLAQTGLSERTIQLDLNRLNGESHD